MQNDAIPLEESDRLSSFHILTSSTHSHISKKCGNNFYTCKYTCNIITNRQKEKPCVYSAAELIDEIIHIHRLEGTVQQTYTIQQQNPMQYDTRQTLLLLKTLQ